MKVILAEKPSVARELAAFVGARARHDGYLEGSGYQVTWAYGHLVELQEPQDYDPALRRWSLETLPFVPDVFRLKLVADKHGRHQFSVIQRLFRAADGIICATDAGREGELIFRYILAMSGCESKTVQRLWLSSLTTAAIREAFGRLRPARDYDRLYAAARCRSEADWIVGINATRNFTVRYGGSGVLWSVGRVQTPVLAMIVRRDDEIRLFQKEPFWELMTRYRDVTFKYRGDRFSQRAEAEDKLALVQDRPFSVVSVDRKEERSQPPQLFDLTELQRSMNRRFGMSADDTLKAAQTLYEAKLITYPRTDSRYLSSDMRKQVPEILQQLKACRPREIEQLDLHALPFSARIVNDRKVSDHHAIIPVGSVPAGLPLPQQRVFDAVVTRFIAVFYPDCLKEVTTVNGRVNDVPFRTRGIRVTQPGWTELEQPAREKEEELDQSLPEFTAGETGPHEPFVKQGETSPPRHFTENTLLGAMETAGNLVDDEQLKEALKEKGIGTPATRAAIIETLLKRDYIVREKKNLLATDLGRYLIALVRDPDLKSPELTGQWEARLRSIEGGQLEPAQFMQAISAYTAKIVRSGEAAVDEQCLGPCPRCGSQVIQGHRGFGCSAWKSGCTFVLWPTYQDHQLHVNEIRQLLQHGALHRPLELAGVGRVILSLTDSGAVTHIPVPEGKPRVTKQKHAPADGARPRKRSARPTATRSASAPAASLGNCPLCQAQVRDQPQSYRCSGWTAGCPFTIWKTIAGKKISSSMARTLLTKGQTGRLKGFKSKSGKSFDARLKLIDGKVQFDFSE